MTPAGVGTFSPDDLQPTLLDVYQPKNYRDLLANQAHGAEGKRPHNLSRPNFLSWIFQVAPVGKIIISERRKARPTLLAARLYRPHFYSDEPQPEPNKCPPFRNFTARRTLGLSVAKTRPAIVIGHP